VRGGVDPREPSPPAILGASEVPTPDPSPSWEGEPFLYEALDGEAEAWDEHNPSACSGALVPGIRHLAGPKSMPWGMPTRNDNE